MNSEREKRVAIIGAGASGLAATKSMLDQGLIPTLFEKNAKVGSSWQPGVGNTWYSMKTNLSYFNMSLSDLPWPNPPSEMFASAMELHDYLQCYAKHFDLEKYAKLNSLVFKVRQVENDRWEVKWRCKETNNEYEDVFDFVILSMGMYSAPDIPDIPGISKFKGLIAHSSKYQSLKANGFFKDKKVITIGQANSGSEVSGDLVAEGASVVNIFHRSFWLIPRSIPASLDNLNECAPWDFFIFSRKAKDMLTQSDSIDERNKMKNTVFNIVVGEQNRLPYEALHINPDSSEMPRIAVSDTYLPGIKSGKITPIKSDIKEFDETGVILVNGSRVDADAIIWCTGYQLRLDFLEDSVLKTLEYEPSDRIEPIILYKNTFHPDIKNLAFAGVLKEPIYFIDELQGRWASLVFSGKLQLPDRDKMNKYMENERFIRNSKTLRQSVAEIFIQYADTIAEEFGAVPDLDKIKETDPELYNMICEGPGCSFHFRLNDKFEYASKVIRNIYDIRGKCMRSELK